MPERALGTSPAARVLMGDWWERELEGARAPAVDLFTVLVRTLIRT